MLLQNELMGYIIQSELLESLADSLSSERDIRGVRIVI